MITDINEMHAKFGVHDIVKNMHPAQLVQFLVWRLQFIEEELKETYQAKTPEDVVDGLIDILVVTLGTLDAFNVDTQKAWDAVHTANMAKQPGYNEHRKNMFGFPDLVKPEGWVPPDHTGNTGLLAYFEELL